MNEKLTSQEAYLFQAALGIQSPWYITSITLNQETHELHIYLDFKKGSQFPCPLCNTTCSCYDTQDKTWRHLSFFEYTTFLHARTPRVSCKEDGWCPSHPSSLGSKRKRIYPFNGSLSDPA